jgi:CRISPR-associated protein Csm4
LLFPKTSFQILLHSDTLFGAICWAIRTLFGEKKLLQIIEEFQCSPPFFVSSGFPFKQIGNKRYFYLPKPLLSPLSIREIRSLKNKAKIKLKPYHHKDKAKIIEIVSAYKRFKKLSYIPFAAFKKVQKGASERDLFIDFLDNKIKDIKFIQTGIVQKNRLDRLCLSTSTGFGEVFFEKEMTFQKEYGLYFLLKSTDKYLNEYLRPALLFLQDSGIGPNAKTGKNWFEIEIDDEPLFKEMPQTHTFITLSRYVGIDNIDIEGSYYNIETVRSKVESRFEFAGENIWKDQIMYFSAGSVIKTKDKKAYYGSLLPVKKIKGKTVYQYGYAYPAYIQEE